MQSPAFRDARFITVQQFLDDPVIYSDHPDSDYYYENLVDFIESEDLPSSLPFFYIFSAPEQDRYHFFFSPYLPLDYSSIDFERSLFYSNRNNHSSRPILSSLRLDDLNETRLFPGLETNGLSSYLSDLSRQSAPLEEIQSSPYIDRSLYNFHHLTTLPEIRQLYLTKGINFIISIIFSGAYICEQTFESLPRLQLQTFSSLPASLPLE